MELDANYWETRYQNNQTGWDIGYPSTPLKTYIDQLSNKQLQILVPGGGNGYEAAYLHQQGFQNVYLLDWAAAPLKAFAERYPTFPKEHLWQQDFFALEQTFDLVLEQTFFCALNPHLREKYALKMQEILQPKGKLVGVLFDIPLNDDKPPFGGNKESYQQIFEPYFNILHLEKCYNSISPREGNELFIILQAK